MRLPLLPFEGSVLAQGDGRASTAHTDSGPAGARGSRLSSDEERQLVVAAERGDRAARRELVAAFLPAIGSVAGRFDSSGDVQRTELMQEGIAGLLFAARRYDPRTGTPFWAYASFWVRKAMQELVADVTRPVALSDHAVRALAEVKAARRKYVAAHGAEPTRAELAGETGFTRAQLDSLLATERTPRSFDEPLDADAGVTATFGETFADPGAEAAYEHVLDEIEVGDFANRLDDRERAVLWRHYGLDQPPQTLSTIGASLGLTAERVRQIEAGALEKLRAAAAPPSDGGHTGI
jgi:RNA polymerase sigma factor (sigma-70 family)